MAELREVFPVAADDFVTAGEASGQIKRILKKLGVSSSIVRRISIASYEAEINLVIHSDGGQMELVVDEDEIKLLVTDVGPGIPDIEKAMEEGYSTASDNARMMGFGAGMGLSNMARNADVFHIESKAGTGTKIQMIFTMQ